MGDLAHFHQPIEHQVCAVFAVVGIDQEIRETDCLVVGKPFQNERSLIAHTGHDQGASLRGVGHCLTYFKRIRAFICDFSVFRKVSCWSFRR